MDTSYSKSNNKSLGNIWMSEEIEVELSSWENSIAYNQLSKITKQQQNVSDKSLPSMRQEIEMVPS